MKKITEALKTTHLYNWINLFAFIAMVTVNILANALPLGGNTSGQVSDRYPSLFTPAGITFAIWGVIYAFLGFVLIRQLITSREDRKVITYNIGGLFAVSCVLNIGWIFSWHFGLIAGSTLIIFVLLANLIILMVLVRYDLLLSLAFGVYTAWILVASIASIFVQLAADGMNLINAGGEAFAMIAIIVSGALLTMITLLTRNWTFSAVGIWAFTGIVIRQVSQYDGVYMLVTGSALLMILVMIVSIALIAYLTIKKEKPEMGRFISEQSPEAVPG